jgi:hypothetical protein
MAQVGNAANCKLNGEWGKHVRGKWKKLTSKLRRILDKKVVRDRLSE